MLAWWPVISGHFLTAAGFFDREEVSRAAEQKFSLFEKFCVPLRPGTIVEHFRRREWSLSLCGNACKAD